MWLSRFFWKLSILVSKKRRAKYKEALESLNKKEKERERLKLEKETKKMIAETMRNTNTDDERIIEAITIRPANDKEKQIINSNLNKLNIKVTRSEYRNYCASSKKYKNKVYSIINLKELMIYNDPDKNNIYKKSMAKYVLIYLHTTNKREDTKFKLVHKLYVDLNGEFYAGAFGRLYRNPKFIEKIWKEAYKCIDKEIYKRNIKKYERNRF